MPKFYPKVALADPKKQAEQREGLASIYRRFMGNLQRDLEPALNFPGNPLGPMAKLLPMLGLGIKTARGIGVRGIRKYLAKTFGTGRKGMPKFRSTEEAIVFGADRAGDQRTADLLRAAQKETRKVFDNLPKGSQARADIAFEGQFYREALETVEGKTTPRLLERLGYKGYVPMLTPSMVEKKVVADAYDKVREVAIKGLEGKVKSSKGSGKTIFREKTDLPLYDAAVKNPKYFREAKGITTKKVYLTPDQYIDEVVTEFEKKGYSKEDVLATRGERSYLRKKAQQGKKLDMPSIEYGPEGMMNQEGLHRALLSKELGIEKIPVLKVFNKVKGE